MTTDPRERFEQKLQELQKAAAQDTISHRYVIRSQEIADAAIYVHDTLELSKIIAESVFGPFGENDEQSRPVLEVYARLNEERIRRLVKR